MKDGFGDSMLGLVLALLVIFVALSPAKVGAWVGEYRAAIAGAYKGEDE